LKRERERERERERGREREREREKENLTLSVASRIIFQLRGGEKSFPSPLIMREPRAWKRLEKFDIFITLWCPFLDPLVYEIFLPPQEQAREPARD